MLVRLLQRSTVAWTRKRARRARWRAAAAYRRAIVAIVVAGLIVAPLPVALAVRTAGAQDYSDVHRGVAPSRPRSPAPPPSPAPSPAAAAAPPYVQARTLWGEAASLASQGLDIADDAAAAAKLRSALEKYLKLIDWCETWLGLKRPGGPPFYAVEKGLEIADVLHRAYLGVGRIYQNLWLRSLKTGKPDIESRNRTAQYLWQAAATSAFQLDSSRWERKLFPEVFRVPDVARMEGGGRSAADELHSFTILMTGKEFNEAKSETNRTKKGLVTALRDQITQAYKELDTPPESYLTDLGERLSVRDLASLRFHRKQEAANQIADAHFQIGTEYLTAARAQSKDEDYVLALRSLQQASVQVYWSRTKRFRVSNTQVKLLVKSLLARFTGQHELAQRIAEAVGLPVEDVQVALDRFAEELVGLLRVPGIGSGEGGTATIPVPSPPTSPEPTPAAAAGGGAAGAPVPAPGEETIERLLVYAASGDTARFGALARQARLVRDDADPRIPALINKLKEMLYRDTVPYGYWIGVDGIPEIARTTYFAALKERYGINVPPLASTIALENVIRALRGQEVLSGRRAAAAVPAQAAYRKLEALQLDMERKLAVSDYAGADKIIAGVQAELAALDSMPESEYARAEATYYLSSFKQLRSRIFLRWGQAHYEQARRSDRNSPEYRRHLKHALSGYYTAADPYPLRTSEKVRGTYFKRQGGDVRQWGRFVDNAEAVGKRSIHEDIHAQMASRRLNNLLEELVTGSDPAFTKTVQEIVREILALRTGTSLAGPADGSPLDRLEKIKVAVSEIFGNRGIVLGSTELGEVVDDLVKILFDNTIDEGTRRVKTTEVAGRVVSQATGGGIVEDVAASMEEKISAILASDEGIPPADRELKGQLETLVREWDRRLARATPAAAALNELFFRVAEGYRSRMQRALAEADAKAAAGDQEAAKAKRREAAGYTLNALRMFYVASQRVYYGNDQAFAVQLPEWDMTLYLAYRTYRGLRYEAPAVGQSLAALFRDIAGAPGGAKLEVLATRVREVKSLVVEGFKTLVKDARTQPVRLVGRGFKAAGRGIFGRANSTIGKIISLGGIAFFVVARYGKTVTLEGNRTIVLEDTAVAEQAHRAFWDLITNRVIVPLSPAPATTASPAPDASPSAAPASAERPR
jgi:hypothetical protein